MNVVVVGGSAPSTPSFFRSLAAQDISSPIHFLLTGRAYDKLRAVRRASAMLVFHAHIEIDIALQETAGVFSNADLIIIQARFGGLEGREFDESYSLDLDICGDEGLGPGGFSAGWRGWPHLSEVLSRIQAESPSSKIILLSAPLALYVRCARLAFPLLDLVGLCELPWTTLKQIARITSSRISDMEYDYIGSNHTGFFYNIHTSHQTSIESDGATFSDNLAGFPSAKLINTIKAYPLKYLELYYEKSASLLRQRNSSRSKELMHITSQAMAVFQNGTMHQIKSILEMRGTPWYEHSLVPYVKCVSHGTGSNVKLFFTTENNGYHNSIADNVILEVPYEVDSSGKFTPKQRSANNQAPEGISEMIIKLIAYEDFASQVILLQDTSLIAEALYMHPWIDSSRETSEVLAQRIIEHAHA